jgi:hypothetical protein
MSGEIESPPATPATVRRAPGNVELNDAPARAAVDPYGGKERLIGCGGDPHNTDGAAVMHRRGILAIQNATT